MCLPSSHASALTPSFLRAPPTSGSSVTPVLPTPSSFTSLAHPLAEDLSLPIGSDAETRDGDVWAGLTGDGVGDEEYGAGDGSGGLGSGDGDGTGDGAGEEAEDGNEDDTEAMEGTPARAGKKSINDLPKWLQDAYNAAITSPLLSIRTSHANGRSVDLYNVHGTFWLPRKDTFFVLQDAKNLTAAAVYQPQFFYWDPKLLVRNEALLCPRCKVAHLHRHGWYHRPIRVVGLQNPYWIIGPRYRCPQCRSKSNKKNCGVPELG